MKRIVTGITALALAATGALVTSPASTAQAAERTRSEPTRFALHGSGYGSRLIGGDAPVSSDTTAFQALGCTNRSGKSTGNHVTRATLPGVGTAWEVSSRTWTTSRRGVVSTRSSSSIERVVLRDPAGGRLVIQGLESFSRAFNNGRYDAVTSTRIGSITHVDAAGQIQQLALPTPGQPIEVPGLAKISVGAEKTRVWSGSARAVADAVDIEFFPSSTRLRLAKSEAQITGGVQRGLFRGAGASIRASGLDDNVSVGRLALTLMPCRGTDGELRLKSIAEAHLGEDGNILVRGLSARQLGDQTMRVASGFERSRIAAVEINGGEIVAENIIGRANVLRSEDGLRRHPRGTEVGAVTVQGEQREFPENEDVIHVPGVVRLERSIVERHPTGISVTALRITLLDGTGVVLDLGNAMLKIRDSGR